MKTEPVNTLFLSTQFRSMWRPLWWAVRDCLTEWISGSWTFNQNSCVPAEAMGIASWFLQWTQKPGLFHPAGGDADSDGAQEAGGFNSQVPPQAPLSLEHELHSSRGMLSSGKALPPPKLDFLWRTHHTSLLILRLCCRVILCKAALGPSLSLCKWGQWHKP